MCTIEQTLTVPKQSENQGVLSGICDIHRSAIAVMESEGFTPGFAEIMEPSTTNMFLYPKTSLSLLMTPFSGLGAITAPPRMCAVEGIPDNVSKTKEVDFPWINSANF